MSRDTSPSQGTAILLCSAGSQARGAANAACSACGQLLPYRFGTAGSLGKPCFPWRENCSLPVIILQQISEDKPVNSSRRKSTVVNDPIKFGVQPSPKAENKNDLIKEGSLKAYS